MPSDINKYVDMDTYFKSAKMSGLQQFCLYTGIFLYLYLSFSLKHIAEHSIGQLN